MLIGQASLPHPPKGWGHGKSIDKIGALSTSYLDRKGGGGIRDSTVKDGTSTVVAMDLEQTESLRCKELVKKKKKKKFKYPSLPSQQLDS